MIALNDCKDRYLYRIASRNLTHGVFCAKRGGFIGIRNKFDYDYLFMEYHWDVDPHYGTVKPLEEIEPLPENIQNTERIDDDDNQELFDWLDRKRRWQST